MSTAFVAGATGYTGREVVRQLAGEGGRVIAHVRPDSGRRDDWQQRFTAMGAEVDFTPWPGPSRGLRSSAVQTAMTAARASVSAHPSPTPR